MGASIKSTVKSSRKEGGEYLNEILIRKDGTVAFKHLTAPMLDLAVSLNPEDPRADRKGRVLACSMLVSNHAVHSMIRENKINQLVNVIMSGKQEGMLLMDDVIKEMYEKAIISYDTALDNIFDPEKLRLSNSSGDPE